jgi:hypothetical protein
MLHNGFEHTTPGFKWFKASHRVVIVIGRFTTKTKNYTPWLLVRKRTIPTERPLVAKLVLTFADRGCSEVSATDPHGR